MKTLSDYKGQAVQLRQERDKAKGRDRQEFDRALEFVRRKIAAIELQALWGVVFDVVVVVGIVRLIMSV